ncbi:hypothetical protein [Streptomyces sp. N35]|uniref:hypothetical protein n=1 Tax=Streptomyces sp. N35 TaxID=2795730 RepID=UPI0018F485AD|nr:hypothetical protein [Streptomyces sp. N35]
MSDIHELQLSLDLPGDLPNEELGLLQWHLGDGGDDSAVESPDEYPLLSSCGALS